MILLFTFAIISREMIFLIVALPLATAIGFAIGMLYERWYHFSAIKTLGKRFEKLFQNVSHSLEKAEAACQIFNQHPESQRLNKKQLKQMQQISGKLTGELNRIEQSCKKQSLQNQSSIVKQPAISKKKQRAFEFPHWKQTPIDERTGFPDATSYQGNLQLLLTAMQQTKCKSAVLFIRLDQFSRHTQRYGEEVAQSFLTKTGKIVLRKLREHDILAQATDDLLIAIVPNIQPNLIQKMANSARQVVRSHRFLNTETDQEVFVTASFSYTLFDETLAKNKTPDQELWDRCQNALAASQKQGRCQLHEMTDLGISRLIAG